MPRASRQALRRLVAHNASPEQSGSSNRQRDSTRRESRPRDRSSGGSSRHSNASEEERIPAWAQTLLDAQKESDQRLKSLEHKTGRQGNERARNGSVPPCLNSSTNGIRSSLTLTKVSWKRSRMLWKYQTMKNEVLL